MKKKNSNTFPVFSSLKSSASINIILLKGMTFDGLKVSHVAERMRVYFGQTFSTDFYSKVSESLVRDCTLLPPAASSPIKRLLCRYQEVIRNMSAKKKKSKTESQPRNVKKKKNL